jgi:hypothetical protein
MAEQVRDKRDRVIREPIFRLPKPITAMKERQSDGEKREERERRRREGKSQASIQVVFLKSRILFDRIQHPRKIEGQK